MNFTEFSFWWILVCVTLPFLLVRQAAVFVDSWTDANDRRALMVISLVLFWNAASSSFVVFCVELVVNFSVVRLVVRSDHIATRVLAYVTIALDLAVLAHFKYLEFLVASFVVPLTCDLSLFGATSGIPPGISFYTFQMIAFLVDTLRRTSRGAPSFVDYVNFASFFPQVVAGPIERRAQLLPQIERFRFEISPANIDVGFRWLALGFFMKFVLADNLAHFVKIEETGNAWGIWFSALLFGFRIYFDFAGYSFIALGIARTIGIELTVNFHAPYMSTSLIDFWRRWHVTLSGWFRDYVYFPLGGSRRGWVAANLVVVFCVSGLWHGAGWNFVLWGAYHGLLMVCYRRYNLVLSSLPKSLMHAVTFGFITLGWLFFMDADFQRIVSKFSTLFSPSSYSLQGLKLYIHAFAPVERVVLALSTLLAVLLLACEYRGNRHSVEHPYSVLIEPWPAMAMLGATVLFSARLPAEFVYFAF